METAGEKGVVCQNNLFSLSSQKEESSKGRHERRLHQKLPITIRYLSLTAEKLGCNVVFFSQKRRKKGD